MKSTVIIDDNPVFTSYLSLLISKYDEYKVVAEAHSGREGMLAVEHYRPDLIIMDIMMPDNDGLTILKHMQAKCKSYNPFIYIITAMETPVIKAILEDLKVDFISFKPIQDEFKVTEVLDKVLLEKPKSISSNIQSSLNTPVDIIVDVMDEFGLPTHLMGREYIRTILIFMLDNPTRKRNLYSIAATVFNCTSRTVGVSISNAIKACMDSEMYRKEFGDIKAEGVLFLNRLLSIIEKRVRKQSRIREIEVM